METFKINVLSVENIEKGIENLDGNDLLKILPRIEKDCKLRPNSMLTFYYMFNEYIQPPSINSIIETLIQYILEDNNYIPTISLDLTVAGTRPWEYYIPKKVPDNVIRIKLPYNKNAFMFQQNKRIQIIIPSNIYIDLKSINNDSIEHIKSIFLTAYYYREIKTNYFKNANQDIIKDYKEKLIPNSIKLDKNIQKVKDIIERYVKIFPKDIYSQNQIINIIVNYNIFSDIINFYKKESNDFINLIELKKKLEQKEQLLVNNRNTSIEIYKNYLVKNIIKSNFKNIFLKLKNTYDSISYKTIFSHMNDKDINYVNKRYDLITNYKKTMDNNNCPHIEIVRKFRKEISTFSKMKYYKIIVDQFLADPETTDKIHTCKLCGFNLICPHILSSWNLFYNNAPGIDVRKKLDDYKAKDGDIYQDFCRVCSEVMFDANYDEIEGETYRILYAELFKYLWSQTLTIFSILKITPKMNIFDFSSIIVYGVLPIITKSNITYVRNQINAYFRVNILNSEVKAYIIMYIYGYILNIVRTSMFNPNKGYIKITLDDDIKSKNISDYAKNLIEHFSSSYRHIYNQLNEVNIVDLLLEIYTEISKSNSYFSIKRSNKIEKVIFDEIIKNTIFNYSFNIATITNYITIETPESLNIDQYETLIENILGTTIQSIASGKVSNDYTLVYQPKYDSIESVNKYKNIINQDIIKVDQLDSLLRGRTIYSFYIFMKRYKLTIDNKYDIEKDNDLKMVLNGENKIKRISNIYTKFITNTPNFSKLWSKRKYTDDNNITAVITEKGNLYKWNIIVYSDGTEINIDNEEGIKEYKTIVNYKDEKINILKTDTYKKSISTTTEEYFRKSKKQAFFNFYKARCPVSGIHNFEKGICTKCNKKEDENSDDYFKKYYKTYYNKISTMYDTSTKKENIKEKEYISNWVYNERSIISVSSLISISKNIILAIGDMENRTMKEIKEDSNIEIEINSLYDSRISLPLSHYYWVIREYNNMKNGQIETQMLLEILKENKVNLVELTSYKKNLSNDVFIKQVKIVDTILKDSNVLFSKTRLCVIQMICDIIINISNINDYFKKIAISLMQFIIRNEIYTSKGKDNFDRTLLRRVDQVVVEAQGNDDFDISNIDEKDYMKEGDLDYSDIDWIMNT